MSNEIRSLTGLRGVAALYVCLYHLLYGRNSTGHVIQTGLSKGYLSVDVFFVLSGLVMALTYHSMFEGRYSFASHKEFLLRRLARIFPLYVVLLVVSLFVYALLGKTYSPLAVGGNVLLVQAWGLDLPSIINQSWSISTEVGAYVLFPALLVLAFASNRWLVAACFVLAVGAVALSTVLVTPEVRRMMHGTLDIFDQSTLGPMLRCLGGFVLGLLTFRVASQPAVAAVARSDAFGAAMIGLIVAGIAFRANDLLIYPLFPLLVLCLFVNRGWVAAVVGSPLLRWLGLLSYGLYLDHGLVIQILWPASQTLLAAAPIAARGVASALICLSVALLLAQLLHISVELPGRAWVRRLTTRPSRQTDPHSAVR